MGNPRQSRPNLLCLPLRRGGLALPREKQGGPAGCQPSLRESEGLQKPQLRHAHHVTTGDQAVIENADLDKRQRVLATEIEALQVFRKTMKRLPRTK